MDERVAVETVERDGVMCGCVVWLAVPHEALAALGRDMIILNRPLRERTVCGFAFLESAFCRRGSTPKRVLLPSRRRSSTPRDGVADTPLHHVPVYVCRAVTL